jgi:cbb3-type cytochrome oxidase subunit 3
MPNHASNVFAWLWWLGIPLLFVLVVLYVFRPGAKRRYRKDGEMPFEDDRKDHD